MICPNCKCEYIKGVSQCADCGVPLVDKLAANPETAERPAVAVVWQGSDPGERAAVKEALEEAGVPVVDQESAGHLFFPSMNPQTDIYVASQNLERAKKVLADLEAWDQPEELSEGESASDELPEEGGPDDAEDDVSADTSEEWHEDEPVAEVWTGSEESLGETLSVCLREVGIASRMSSEAGLWRLVVRPEKEAKAKEIVREVVDASPPE
jgi:phosphomannomutase